MTATTIERKCSCKGKNPICQLCDGIGTYEVRACQRCAGQGRQFGKACLDCRGTGEALHVDDDTWDEVTDTRDL